MTKTNRETTIQNSHDISELLFQSTVLYLQQLVHLQNPLIQSIVLFVFLYKNHENLYPDISILRSNYFCITKYMIKCNMKELPGKTQ